MNDQDNFVNNNYRKYDIMSPIELVRAMHAMRAIKDEKEEELKTITAEYDFLRNVKLPATFEEQGLEILKVEGVGRCNLQGDMQASIPSDAKDAAYQWLRDTGRSSLIQETVNSSTLKAMLKDMMRKGEAIPEFFRVHVFSRATITKG